MDASGLQTEIEAAWEDIASIGVTTQGPRRTAVEEALRALDSGQLRVAEKIDGTWVTHQWLKKAVLLSFRLNPSKVMHAGALGDGVGPWWDKVPNKFEGWEAPQFEAAGFRAVPGSVVRRGSFVAPGAVLMPSFVNVGAYVGANTMVDTWVTVGSCAQIGANCHLSGAVGIGGVLEPLQANPTIIEDDCFIGARSEVAEGVIVGQGAVISMGVFLNGSTPIIDRKTGETYRGFVPPYSVVVSGTRSDPHGTGVNPYCAIIMKPVDAQTRSKTSINDLLRD